MYNKHFDNQEKKMTEIDNEALYMPKHVLMSKKKEYYFLTGLPRAGNTLLGSLMNQNPNVCITAQSVVVEVLWQLQMIQESMVFDNFPDSKSFENVSKNVFKNYYSRHQANKILDRGHWGTIENIHNIKQNVTNKPKFVILYRPIVEVLASFVKAGEMAQGQELLDKFLPEDSFIGMSAASIKNIITQKEDYIFVTYKELASEPIKTVKKIFEFIEEDYIPIQTTNLKQLNVNGIEYDDSVFSKDGSWPIKLHTIKTDEVKYKSIDIRRYLSETVIQKALAFDDILEYLKNAN